MYLNKSPYPTHKKKKKAKNTLVISRYLSISYMQDGLKVIYFILLTILLVKIHMFYNEM